MTDVPPGRQCTLPSCSREVAGNRGRGGLCSEHLPEPDGSAEHARVGYDANETVRSPEEARRVFGERLEAAGLDTRRFIDVHDGEKPSTNHTRHRPDSTSLNGNYGVYGGAGDGEDTGWIPVDIGVDDYEGERAPDWTPRRSPWRARTRTGAPAVISTSPSRLTRGMHWRTLLEPSTPVRPGTR